MHIEQQATVLLASDVRASREFFVSLLGFEPVFDLGWFASLRHPSAGSTLDLWQRDHPSVPEGHRLAPAGFVLALVVPELAAAERLFARAGVPIVAATRDEPWGQRHFVASGPDGVLLDVVQRIPASPQ